MIAQNGRQWRAGVLRRAPKAGLGALLGAFLSILAAGLVLRYSDDHLIAEWKIQPTVYLAITSAAFNIFLHFALSEAVRISWWFQAMQPRATLGSLHRNWAFNDSLWAAVTSGKHFNVIALSSILVALVPINGPLLQRASQVTQRHFQVERTVDIPIAEIIPEGC